MYLSKFRLDYMPIFPSSANKRKIGKNEKENTYKRVKSETFPFIGI